MPDTVLPTFVTCTVETVAWFHQRVQISCMRLGRRCRHWKFAREEEEDDPDNAKLSTRSAPPPAWTFCRTHISISLITSASTKSVTLSSRNNNAERISNAFSRSLHCTSTVGSDLQYVAMASRRTSILHQKQSARRYWWDIQACLSRSQ